MGKEKKEIWMEKLIELLNEYKKTRVKEYWIEFNIWEEKWELHIIIDDWQDNYSWWTCDTDIAVSYIISKKFWFIEWLVDNEKIDFSKVKEKIWLEWELYDRMLYWYKEEDFLIMILSIENEPIRFLYEILK